MNHYITGATIKGLRESLHMTQLELGNQLGVSDKTISKWETAKGLPDISLLEPLAEALHVSIIELMSGEFVMNRNRSSNMLRSIFYVCPICGNIIHSTGEALISCCGITLPGLEAEDMDEQHLIHIEQIENQYYVTVAHEMTKQHHISFLAYVTTNSCEIVKMYAEGNAQAYFMRKGHGNLYVYCNRHGLMKYKI